MDIDLFRGLITVILLVAFIGLWAWTWSKKRHTDYEAASRMPLGDDDRPPESLEREQNK